MKIADFDWQNNSNSNHLLIQSIAGTVITKASVEIRSMEAASDSSCFVPGCK